MANILQIKRGTTVKRLAYTPAAGELVQDLDTKKLYIGDGTTAGGLLVNPTELSAGTVAMLNENNIYTGTNVFTGGLFTPVPTGVTADSTAVTGLSKTYPAAVVAAWRNVQFSSYKVAGNTSTHFGVIAQEIQSAFTTAGINAADYGLIESTDGILTVRLEECLILEAYINRLDMAKLGVSRKISMTGDGTWSVNFDGSANVTGALALAATGVAAGTYKSVTVDTKGRVTAGNDVVTGLVAATTAAGTANTATTNTNTYLNVVEKVGTADASVGTSTQITGAGTVTVASDANGKLTITGAQTITGNAGSATKLATARNIILSGDATGSASFNGTADANISVTIADKGVANGFATLDATGKVPSTQLPSYVDDVLEYATVSAFPTTGETGKIYVETTGNTTYRWSGTAYVKITSGEVSSVAGKTGVVTLTKSDVGLGNVDNTADSAKSVASAAKLTTARTINGVAFDGTANITVVDTTKAPLASPALTGTPTAPTASTTTNTTQLATTAFVQAVNTADTGGSATALTLKTARTIGITGAVTGSVSFNGGSNVNIAASFGDVDLGVL